MGCYGYQFLVCLFKGTLANSPIKRKLQYFELLEGYLSPKYSDIFDSWCIETSSSIHIASFVNDNYI